MMITTSPAVVAAAAAAEAGSARVGRRFGGTLVKSTVLALVVLLVSGILSVLGTGSASATATPVLLSDLSTNPDDAATESAAGIKVAMMELNWASYEPSQGVFNTTYALQMQNRLAALQAAGMKVTLGLGLHFTPTWVKNLPDGHYIDEKGDVSPEANLIFNSQIRAQAQIYLDRANADLHFANFWAIRVTSASDSEVMYPQGGTYWAFDPSAQNGPNMPATMARNPFPGWKPGTAGLTTDQVNTWATWYVSALDDVVKWQAQIVQNDGFTGYLQVVTPGIGVLDNKLPGLVARNLPDGTLGVGAAWDLLYSQLTTVPHVVVYLSSVADGSKGDTGCTPADDSVPMADYATTNFSSAAWLSRIADQYGYLKSGENPGYSTATQAHYTDPSSTGLMALSINIATTCHYQSFYWAHDDQFWTSPVMPFTQYAAYTTPNTTAPGNAN